MAEIAGATIMVDTGQVSKLLIGTQEIIKPFTEQQTLTEKEIASLQGLIPTLNSQNSELRGAFESNPKEHLTPDAQRLLLQTLQILENLTNRNISVGAQQKTSAAVIAAFSSVLQLIETLRNYKKEGDNIKVEKSNESSSSGRDR